MSKVSAASSTGTGRRSVSKLPQPQTGPSAPQQAAEAVQQGQYNTADAAMYKEMREALAEFDSYRNTERFDSYRNTERNTVTNNSNSPREKPAPRHKAFYAALRSVLAQVLDENTEDARHTRLLAAHQWYVKHKPRIKPRDMDIAAAMAASLSVTCPVTDGLSDTATAAAEAVSAEASVPTDSDAAAGRLCRGLNSSSGGHHRQQQQQQQFVLHGAPRQLPRAQLQQRQQAGGDVDISTANSSRADRWQQQQQRMHADEDDPNSSNIMGPTTAAAAADVISHGHIRAARCLPEQPSMREIPAIQSGEHKSQSMAFFDGRNSSAAAAGSASGPLSWPGQAAGIAAGAAAGPNTDGLIPLGSLPSKRYITKPDSSISSGASYTGSHSQAGHLGSSSSSGAAAVADDFIIGSDDYAASKAHWSAVATAQQRIESAVAAEMQGYSRHRARLEEEISRKQEAAAVTTFESNKNNSVSNSGTRALVHLDSQHRPSEVSAYQWTKGGVQQLVPVNKVKEAKKQLLQESAREVAEVADQLQGLGLTADPAVLEHALMPMPDQAYMVCLAHLPKPGLAPGQFVGQRPHSGEKKSKKKGKSGKDTKQVQKPAR